MFSRVGLRAPSPGDFVHAVAASFPPGASSATKFLDTRDALSAGVSAPSSPDGDSNHLTKGDDEAPKPGVVRLESRLIASVGRFTRRLSRRYQPVGRCLAQESRDNPQHRSRACQALSTPGHGEYTEALTWKIKVCLAVEAAREPVASLELSRRSGTDCWGLRIYGGVEREPIIVTLYSMECQSASVGVRGKSGRYRKIAAAGGGFRDIVVVKVVSLPVDISTSCA